ncbi:MAG: peptidoglycan-binding domain-containing protein [Thiolinea sp.]
MVLSHPRFKHNPRLQQAAENNPALKPGDPDALAVAIIQQALVDLGYALPRSTGADGRLDGDYGAETIAALRQFQQDQGLQVDGLVGRETLRRLGSGSRRPSTRRTQACRNRRSAPAPGTVSLISWSFRDPQF